MRNLPLKQSSVSLDAIVHKLYTLAHFILSHRWTSSRIQIEVQPAEKAA